MITNYHAMLFRIVRAIKALFMGSLLATNPLKGLTLIILSIIVPYLIYAFLGGAVFMLILAGFGFLLWRAIRKETGVKIS
ncbi:MAG TPA: hypothetical protein VKM37_03895 [Balneolaceae bacterium]|nr:hypothetical protein [Balneolaceae bacterium]